MNCEQCNTPMTYHTLSGLYVCPTCGAVLVADNAQQDEQALVGVYEAALQFYADEANYEGAIPVLADRGQLAREALAAE
jgi:uncharacterized Zn finger protein (UPF0148 family)